MTFRTGFLTALVASLLLTITHAPVVNAANEIKRMVPFQGRLHGTDSKVVSDGHYDLTFYIYDTPTGGTALWTEAHPKVSVIHGYINVLLGATSAMDEASYATGDPNYDSTKNLVDFTKKKYLGISINGGAEMFPRSQLVPSFHAYTANHAIHATEADHAKDADSLAGIAGAAYVTEAELSGFSDGILHQSGNLSELSDKATSRTNLDVYSKAETSAQMLDASNNLSDVSNPATARTNLFLYSKSDSDNILLNEASNLSDLTDVAAARTNLDVHSKAEAGVTFLDSANNLGDLGSVVSARNTLNIHSKTESDTEYLNASSNLSDVTNVAETLVNLGVDGDLKETLSNTYSRFDVGKLRIYFGFHQVAGNGWVHIVAEPNKCFSTSTSYSVMSTLNTTDGTADMPANAARNSACSWYIANAHPNTIWLNWMAIGMAE